MGDRSLEKFRVEYEKLHRALKKSHESEKRLMQKCRELNAEIAANSAKVSTALKLSQDDQSTIASLKKVQYYYYTCSFMLSMSMRFLFLWEEGGTYLCCKLYKKSYR